MANIPIPIGSLNPFVRERKSSNARYSIWAKILHGSEPHQAELFVLANDIGQLLETAAERYSD